MSEPALHEKVLAIHRLLSREKIPHAFGGALALAYYAEPRSTIDIDVNVFLSPADYPVVERALAKLGVGDGADADAVTRDGQCRLRWGSSPIDLFFAYDALHDAMRTAIRKQPFADTRIPVLSPEHLLVCKAIFNRPKDWLDIEQMIVAVERLDMEEVRRWLGRILGPDDPRMEHLESLLRAPAP
jgi:hypothetical protein